ncbi:AAA family ATPase [archaeon]|jgi:KaiC/GvpD/RAD55 family RecA-like ATPase|nr:AAA family ATPase [archaeon]
MKKFEKELGEEEMELNKKFQTPIVEEKETRKTSSPVQENKEISKETKEMPEENPEEKPPKGKLNLSEIAQEVKQEMVSKQRKHVEEIPNLKDKKLIKKDGKKYIFTGIPGFDELLEKGIPQGNSLIVAGGAGSGKTIMCLQTLINKAKEGSKCLYMTLEEREDRLLRHMEDFGWPAKKLVKKKKLKIIRMNPFEITRNVDALLAKQKGELLIEIDPVIMPKDFKPDFIVIDSLTAIASAFTGKDESYRIYIEQLFRFLEKTNATSFLITETEQVPKIFSQTGVEEFLADGVIVLYNLKHGNIRENALEILKLRGAAHQKKIVAMQITGDGIVVYPEQEVFSDIE